MIIILLTCFVIYKKDTNIYIYLISMFISLTGLNYHHGFTINLARITLLSYLLFIFVKLISLKTFKIPEKYIIEFSILFTLIIVFQLFSTVFSESFIPGLREIFINISVMLFFLVVILLCRDLQTASRAIVIYLFVGFFQSIYGIYNIIGAPDVPTYQSLLGDNWSFGNDKTKNGFLYLSSYNLFRPVSFIPSDPSHFAFYMSGITLLSFWYLIISQKKAIAIFFSTLTLILLFLTLSRSAMLSFLIIGLPNFVFLINKTLKEHNKKPLKIINFIFNRYFILGATIFAFGFVYKFSHHFNSFWIRVKSLISPDTIIKVEVDGTSITESTLQHLMTKLTAIDAFVNHPFLGVGLGRHIIDWKSFKYQDSFTGSHSHYLDILAQTGFIGFSLQIIFIYYVAYNIWKGARHNNGDLKTQLLINCILSMFLTIIFGNLLYHVFILDYVWFIMAIGFIISKKHRKLAK